MLHCTMIRITCNINNLTYCITFVSTVSTFRLSKNNCCQDWRMLNSFSFFLKETYLAYHREPHARDCQCQNLFFLCFSNDIRRIFFLRISIVFSFTRINIKPIFHKSNDALRHWHFIDKWLSFYPFMRFFAAI